MDFREMGWKDVVQIHLKRDTNDGLLWKRKRTFWFHKKRRISYLSECLLSSEEGPCFMEVVTTELLAFI